MPPDRLVPPAMESAAQIALLQGALMEALRVLHRIGDIANDSLEESKVQDVHRDNRLDLQHYVYRLRLLMARIGYMTELGKGKLAVFVPRAL